MPTIQKYVHLPIDAYSSQAACQFLIDGFRINGDGIQPVGLWVSIFGPSKVAKIRANADVSPIAGMGVHIASAMPTAERHQLFHLTAANDNHRRVAA